MHYIGPIISKLVMLVLMDGVYRATKYLEPGYVIKSTRQGKLDKRSPAMTVLVTVGKPNYAERQFIKKCKLAGEPFPVKKIQLCHKS